MHDFWNDWPGVILGAEGDPDPKPEPKADDEEPDDSGDGDDGDDGNDEGEGEDKGDKSAEDLAAVQKALAAERRNNKRLERENRRLTATKETKDAEKEETIEESKQKEAAATARAEKLAAGLLKRDIDTAIKEAARDLKFLDVEDALNGVDRSKIVFDQDDEDPTDIDIDEATVKAAVKALATRKPHFLNSGTDDGDATGSAFGGSKKRNRMDEEAALREHYPSL